MLLTIKEAMELYKNNEFDMLKKQLWISPISTNNLTKRTRKLFCFFKEAAHKFPPHYKVFFDEKSGGYGYYYDSFSICYCEKRSDKEIYELVHNNRGHFDYFKFQLIFRNHYIALWSEIFIGNWGKRSAADFNEYKKLVKTA